MRVWPFFTSSGSKLLSRSRGTATGNSPSLAELIEDDEVESHEMFGQAARPPCTALGLEPVHEIHNIEEAAASAVADEVIEQFAGVLYRWNTGQVQMRWDIDPAALGGMFSIRWEGLAGHA